MATINRTIRDTYLVRWTDKYLLTGVTHTRRSESTAVASTMLVSRPDVTQKRKPDVYGFRKPTPWGVSELSVSQFAGRIRRRYETSNDNVIGYQDFSGPIGNVFSIPPFDTTMLYSSSSEQVMAETLALAAIKDAKANYATFAAEAGKSVSMVESNILAIAKAYRHARRLRWKEAARALRVSPPSFRNSSRDVASRWLELQYGWLPLLSDMQNIYDDMRNGIAPKLSSKQTVEKDYPGGHSKFFSNGKVDYVTTGKYGCTVRFDFTLQSPGLSLASQMGLTNPASVLWELLPFSFVVDWIAPLSDFFSALDATSGLVFKGGSRTHWSHMERKGKVILSPSVAKNGDLQVCIVEGRARGFYMSRQVYDAAPFPTPFLRPGFGGNRVLNAIALLRGAVR